MTENYSIPLCVALADANGDLGVDLSERPDLNGPMTVAHPPVPKAIIRTRSRGAIAVERMKLVVMHTAGAFNASVSRRTVEGSYVGFAFVADVAGLR